MNQDFEFAMAMMHRALDDASDAHHRKEFENAHRQLRIASRFLADMRRANMDMMRWAHQAESI